MVNFYYGVFSGACFFVCIFLSFRIGRKIEQKQKEDMRKMIGELPVPPPSPVSEEDRKKAERMREGFNQLMSYDVTTATSGKKVVH